MHQLSAGERDELNCEKGKVLNPNRSIVVIYWQFLIRPQWQKYSQINMIVNVRKSLIAVSRPVGDQYVMDSIYQLKACSSSSVFILGIGHKNQRKDRDYGYQPKYGLKRSSKVVSPKNTLIMKLDAEKRHFQRRCLLKT